MTNTATPTHALTIKGFDTTGWTAEGGMRYSPGCTCGVVPGLSYLTEAEAVRMATAVLPAKCSKAILRAPR